MVVSNDGAFVVLLLLYFGFKDCFAVVDTDFCVLVPGCLLIFFLLLEIKFNKFSNGLGTVVCFIVVVEIGRLVVVDEGNVITVLDSAPVVTGVTVMTSFVLIAEAVVLNAVLEGVSAVVLRVVLPCCTTSVFHALEACKPP